MIRIGKSYIARRGGMSYLCAPVPDGDRRNTLWFAVDTSQERYLAAGRADPFVMGFLAFALRGGHEIVCDDPMSERLHWQLNAALIPTLAAAGERYHMVRITAPLTSERYPTEGAVGTAFSGGVDSLYTVMMHGKDSEFPLTHLVVYNSSHYDQFGEKRERMYLAGCRQMRKFARAYGLEAVVVDTSFNDLLGMESRFNVVTFRNLACTLALQGLFSCYLLSSGYEISTLSLDVNGLDETHDSDRYDLLTAANSQTETLSIYVSGAEAKRWQKLQRLAGWEPSWQWLHPCWFKAADTVNCGICGKCIRDLVSLYALGPDKLDRFSAVYDIPDFFRHLPQRIAYIMASAERSLLTEETLQLLLDSGAYIPPAAYVYEKQFRRALCRADGREGQKP